MFLIIILKRFSFRKAQNLQIMWTHLTCLHIEMLMKQWLLILVLTIHLELEIDGFEAQNPVIQFSASQDIRELLKYLFKLYLYFAPLKFPPCAMSVSLKNIFCLVAFSIDMVLGWSPLVVI